MAEVADLRQGMGRVATLLRPHPHRGDLIAAGAAPLTLGVLLLNARFEGHWGTAVLLVVTLLGAGLVLGMGVLAPLEGERPRAYQQVLLLAGLALGFVALLRVAQVLGVHDTLDEAGTRLWVFGLLTLSAARLVRTHRSAICALVAALAGIVAVLAFVTWAFAPQGAGTTRWLLLALAIALVLGALSQRDAHRRESVYLINAAGIAILALGLTFVGDVVLVGDGSAAPAGGGWKLILLAAGFGLIAYAAVDGEPGPGYLGALDLLLAVALVGTPDADGASVWFWPLALLLGGGAMVLAGLRPRHPLPPEPPPASAPSEPLPGPGAPGGLWTSER